MNALIRFARSARTAPLLGCQRPYDFISRNSSQFNRIPVTNYSIIEPLSVNLKEISLKFSEKTHYFNESQSNYEYKQAESSEALFVSSSLNDSPSESNRKATEDYLAELEVAIRDKFKVERLRVVGSGAFGITFAAYTSVYDYAIPSCAIKVVMPKHHTEEYKKHWMKQCEQEIGHLKSVEHDNIVTYHGNMFYQTEDKMQIFFVLQTEYLQRNLEQLLNEIGRPLSIEEAKRIALHIGTAIEYLHSIGIVHHDLKPSNTMIKFDPKQRCALLEENLPTCTAKVIDFGLARRYNNGQVLEKRFYGGTRRYKCKEKLAHRPYNPYLSDSYSFGILLLELLIGIDELWAEFEKEKSMVAVLNNWTKAQTNLTTDDKRFLTAVNGLLAQSETKRWKVSQAIDYIK